MYLDNVLQYKMHKHPLYGESPFDFLIRTKSNAYKADNITLELVIERIIKLAKCDSEIELKIVNAIILPVTTYDNGVFTNSINWDKYKRFISDKLRESDYYILRDLMVKVCLLSANTLREECKIVLDHLDTRISSCENALIIFRS